MNQNRKNRRSHVFLKAELELGGRTVEVKLRNLSADGALIEGDDLPVEGSQLLFRKGDLKIPGRVAWLRDHRAGVSFAQKLAPEQLMRHIPTPKPKSLPKSNRPAVRSKDMSLEERRYVENWLWSEPITPPKG